ncbi:hypothetical protein D030_0179, partial [Vibrio parahaemolyticus AQ3810]
MGFFVRVQQRCGFLTAATLYSWATDG